MLIFENKKIRAGVIADHVRGAGYKGCVCFSCGNASAELKERGLYVLDVSPEGDLAPTQKWWTPEEIHKTFPDLFDATSGHLPAYLMVRIARAFRERLGYLDPVNRVEVPTGSGETILCLKWAYPTVEFVPVFGVGKGSEYDERAPLVGVAEGKPGGIAAWKEGK